MNRLFWNTKRILVEQGKCIFMSSEYLSALPPPPPFRNSWNSLRINVLICRMFSQCDRFIPIVMVTDATHKRWKLKMRDLVKSGEMEIEMWWYFLFIIHNTHKHILTLICVERLFQLRTVLMRNFEILGPLILYICIYNMYGLSIVCKCDEWCQLKIPSLYPERNGRNVLLVQHSFSTIVLMTGGRGAHTDYSIDE